MSESGLALIKDQVIQELDELNKTELEQIVDYIAFIRFRARHKAISTLDEAKLASLYAEFADEDRELAEIGMSDYYEGLKKEDKL
jgi:hypothetical protein